MRRREAQALDLAEYTAQVFDEERPELGPLTFDGITFVVAAYNIPQQLERTLFTCGAEYQNAPADQIEIIVVDNGSDPAVGNDLHDRHPQLSRILRFVGDPSPIKALNEGIRQAKFDNVALIIDGAHMLTPGVFARSEEIFTRFERPVINVPQFMLGDVSQNFSHVDWAFDRETEMLETLGWPTDGYSLFRYAVRATELQDRAELHHFESNCLITNKTVFDACGAFEERFTEPGGGMANPEIFWRLTHEPLNTYVVLPGEGSFHQDHGGTTTSITREERRELLEDFHENNRDITGVDGMEIVRAPHVHGKVPFAAQHVPTISHEYGIEKSRLLTQLSRLHISHAELGTPVPRMHLSYRRPVDESAVRPVLPALGVIEETAAAQGCTTDDLDYLKIMQRIHTEHRPKLYLEIGVANGYSLQLARCPSIGIDPAFEINCTQHFPTSLFKSTSDGFFANQRLCENRLAQGIDLAYIDGMHLAEYVVRDFINVEKWSSPGGVIVLDDVLPEQIEMADRDRHFNAWTGDIYKLIPILAQYRPDLNVRVVEAYAASYRKGLAIITNLDPASTVLDENFDEIGERIAEGEFTVDSIAELESLATMTPILQLFEDGFGRTEKDAGANSNAPQAATTRANTQV